jgi:phosphatidylglycerophosphatase A
MERVKLTIASCGFLGCSPVAPRVLGTLGGVALAWALRDTTPYLAWVVGACLLVYVVGRALAPWAAARAGGGPGVFVLDEVLGYQVTIAWVKPPSYLTLLVGFALFRLFDVLEPGPVRRASAISGGDGILLHGLLAGVLGLAVLGAARLLFPGVEQDIWTWKETP